VGALGSQGGISKSRISHICREIDQQVQAFLNRGLQVADYAYLYLNATYLKGRLGKAQQDCSRAFVVAMGVNEDGRRGCSGSRWATARPRLSAPKGRSGLDHRPGAGSTIPGPLLHRPLRLNTHPRTNER
jgi:hypothetical protein